jgi:hypothetical protein
VKRTGTWETVAAIACFSGLIAYQNNPYWLIAMIGFAFVYLAFNGE